MIGKSKPTNRRAEVTCIVLTGLLTVACASPDPVYLPALEADPMASYSHPDLDLVSSHSSPKHTGWFGWESDADVSRAWLLEDGGDVDSITGHIVQAAERAGWAIQTLDPEPVEGGEPFWRAHKYLNEGLATLVFRWDPSSWRGGTELWLHLDFTDEDLATPALAVVRDATYRSLADLRDAIEAAGLWCPEYTSWNPSATRYDAKTKARCNESVWMYVFDTEQQTQTQLQRSLESGGDQVYLVGPNWIVSCPDNGDLGEYLQGLLGGDLTGGHDV